MQADLHITCYILRRSLTVLQPSDILPIAGISRGSVKSVIQNYAAHDIVDHIVYLNTDRTLEVE
jgi:hypothetical protein